MNNNHEIENFISEIKSIFPDVGEQIDKRMADFGYGAEEYMHTSMMESFSQATTDAIKAKDSETVSKHLNYMARKLIHASALEREYIDVYYVEPLMWDIKDRKIKSWGWKLFPESIKELYENMWGEQDL